MTQNFISVYQFHKTGSGQFQAPRQVNLSPGLAKIAPWWLARRDSFSAKAPEVMVGVSAPPTLSAHTRFPLAARQITACSHYTRTSDAQARVLRPIPATVPSPPNTCFFASPDFAV